MVIQESISARDGTRERDEAREVKIRRVFNVRLRARTWELSLICQRKIRIETNRKYERSNDGEPILRRMRVCSGERVDTARRKYTKVAADFLRKLSNFFETVNQPISTTSPLGMCFAARLSEL